MGTCSCELPHLRLRLLQPVRHPHLAVHRRRNAEMLLRLLAKSGRRREVPMRQAVYAALTSLPEPHEGRVFKSRSIRTAFENAVKVAGLDAMNRLDGEPFTLHGCRHHFASWFMMRGGSLQALKELLGHADIKTTLIYAHLSPAHLRDEVVKTERGTEPVERITQEITQEPTDRQLMSRN